MAAILKMTARKIFLSSPINSGYHVFHIKQISLKSKKLLKIGKIWQPFCKWLPGKKMSSPLISEHCFYYKNTFHVHNITIVCEKLAKSAYLSLCSIFSNDGHVFRRIKNTHNRFANNTLKTNHAKLQMIWLSSFTGEDFQRYNIKKAKKTSKRGNNSHLA